MHVLKAVEEVNEQQKTILYKKLKNIIMANYKEKLLHYGD